MKQNLDKNSAREKILTHLEILGLKFLLVIEVPYNPEYAVMFLCNSMAHQENFNIPYLTAANDKITVLGYSQSVTEQ